MSSRDVAAVAACAAIGAAGWLWIISKPRPPPPLPPPIQTATPTRTLPGVEYCRHGHPHDGTHHYRWADDNWIAEPCPTTTMETT